MPRNSGFNCYTAIVWTDTDIFYKPIAILAVFSVAGLPIRTGLRAIERTEPVFIGYVVSTIFSVIAAPLVPGLFGLKGISVALILTQVLNLPILVVSLRRGLNDTTAWSTKVAR